MVNHAPTLHLMCGKIGSGKSTLARQLGGASGAVVICEDDWLAALYAGDMNSIADYVRRSAMLRVAMRPHVRALLGAGVSVALDFPANTVDSRAWLRGLIDETGVAHVLHWLDVPDAVCKARLRQRNAAGEHPFAVTEDQFELIAGHFVPPAADEGFNTVLHRPGGNG